MYRHAYLIGAILWAVAWVVIFVLRKDLRKQMLIMSGINSLYGVTEHFYYGEYWRPEFTFKLPGINASLESILLMFVYGGLTAAMIKFCVGKYMEPMTITSSHKWQPRLVVVAITVAGFLTFGAFRLFTSLNVIYPSILVCTMTAVGLCVYRKDLIGIALLSMALLTVYSVLVFSLYEFMYPGIFETWWNMAALCGIRVGALPLEEVAWHAAIGFSGPLLYEVWCGNALVSRTGPLRVQLVTLINRLTRLTQTIN